MAALPILNGGPVGYRVVVVALVDPEDAKKTRRPNPSGLKKIYYVFSEQNGN